ncbi:Dipeptidyl aminopeptidase/acylaminoacyl peptidase [Nonomuraea solani]|uniref:Dipeptidyl aminopeptidase/acylaminoacyl peptidase n=1 Tax=Nonomuraea solani TaxID=1144553 RepID=A0A1H5TTG4_9ACTN|nr:prolyl oligopeptidase family serine peptidase [Nonomuraea solani]SEF66125.1 Dipeptidyl aminopeptidase/acylaminoacyl peptidase [Nonomuraea solani]
MPFWPSPITTRDVAGSGVRPGWPTAAHGRVWWTEDRPGEGGRTTIVCRTADGTHRDLLPAPWCARTRVHEYGGKPYAVTPSGEVVFANLKDQRLYLLPENGEPKPLTPEGDRYADLLVRDGQVWCVRERHTEDGKVTRAIVSIPLNRDPTPLDGNPAPQDGVPTPLDGGSAPLDGGSTPPGSGEIREWVTGCDFYASPEISPDGRHLAYVCWNHPRMPWDGTELRVTPLTGGDPWTVAGGPAESVLAPSWKDDSHLYLISDSSGWWNLYEIGLHGDGPRAVYPAEEEFTLPPWRLGGTPYTVLADGRIAVLHGRGDLRLGILDPTSGELTDLDLPHTGWDTTLTTDGTTVTGIGYAATIPRSVVTVHTGREPTDVRDGGLVLRRDLRTPPDPAYLPLPQAVTVPVGRQQVHAFLYPPRSPAATDETPTPPYVVFVHGGPTAHADTALDLEKAFLTSRGIGVLDVNYGGSTGYGRVYRDRLKGRWGLVDVADTIAAARWLAAEGLADPTRIAVRGGSAGGWTVMAACCRSDVFAGGVSYYGVSALAPLVAHTHDFESRYVEWLVGPEDPQVYATREPLALVDGVSCPMLLLQGLEDPVVPPEQSAAFADALSERGVPCTYLAFEGESHGFRRTETRAAALAAELAFYQQLFG